MVPNEREKLSAFMSLAPNILMKQILMSDLPEGVWFWRTGNPERWLAISNGLISPLRGLTTDGPPFDPTELVLLDPNWCEICFEQKPFPPLSPCAKCGYAPVEQKIGQLRQTISQWTGEPESKIHL